MAAEFEHFIRRGGGGQFQLRRQEPAERKGAKDHLSMPDYAARAAAFAARARQVLADETKYALEQVWARLRVLPAPEDIPPTDALLEAVVAEWDAHLAAIWQEWSQQTHQLPEAIARMEEHLLNQLRARAAAFLQTGLGFSEYIWRSQDDGKVRSDHRAYDDQIFDWSDPPPGGHPGEGHNCRCWAEPYLPPEADEGPLTGLAFLNLWLGAEWRGTVDATGDAIGDLIGGIAELPGKIAAGWRFARLLAEEQLGTLSEEETAELAETRARIDAAIAAVVDLYEHAPEVAEALYTYLRDLHDHPNVVDDAYARGLATEGDVARAHYDRAYFDQLVLMNVLPGVLLAKVVRRLSQAGELAEALPGAAALLTLLRDGLALLWRKPWDVDWPEVANDGIVWGKGIRAQGAPWEEMLDQAGGLGMRLAPNFKAFDFWDIATKTATSAKTLDTSAFSYRTRPTAIYARLKSYVDKLVGFDRDEKDGEIISDAMIKRRRLILGIPANTSPEQIVQLRRAIEYAEEKDIDMSIFFIGE